MTKRKAPEDILPSGRPTKYKESYNEQGRKLCLLGYTDKELADFFAVDESTLNNWKNMYPKFLESLNAGKHVADAIVADKLHTRAKGYRYKEIKIDDNGKTTTTTKEVPPDTTAQIFWLKNRQRKKWTDEKKVELEVKTKLEDLLDD